MYANAVGEGLWELCCCVAHYHPSVAAWGRALLAGMPVEYSGDPLKDMGLAAFLDKFMLKKPKVGADKGNLICVCVKTLPQ